jgi:hypothetical protein
VGRRLPDYDPESDGPYETSKRRLKLFKRVYQSYYQWQSLREYGEVDDVITVEGEDIYLGDLLVGQETLPTQQRRAFDLICLQGYTESAATAVILPNSKWSTPVQQYSDDGLRKMVAAYDAKQRGEWDPQEAINRRRKKKGTLVVVTDTAPEVPETTPEETRPKFSRIDHLDWTTSSAENKRLAEFINAKTGLNITGEQVKAVAFLRKPWYRSAAEAQIREDEAKRKDDEKAKYAYETPEQREKRFAAARALKSAEAAAARAEELQREVRQLRIDAGLDPDTGEPVAQ